MGKRSGIAGVLSSLLSLAEVVRATASATLHILERDGDDDSDECEHYGDAALLSRPPAGADALFVDLDGERVVFGTRETRWLVEMDEGDAVLRALGADTRAYVRLKADGSMELNGLDIRLGDESASNFIALANLVQSAITTAIAGHTHTGVTTGAGSSGNGVLTAPVSSVASARVRSL